MKLTINNQKLLEVLTPLSRFRGNEILQNVLFAASEDEFSFRVTDGEVFYERRLSLQEGEDTIGKIEQTGEIMLPPKFEEVVRKLDKGDISLELKDQTLLLKQGKTTAKVNVMTGEFPPLPESEKGKSVKLSKEILAVIVNQTAFSASDKDSRPVLKAIHFEISEDGLKVVATDSHRLSQKMIKQKIELPTLNIPAKKLSNIIDSLEDKAEVILIPYGNYVLLETVNSMIYIRQLEGNYPDVSRLTNVNEKAKIKVNSKEILSAIDRALTFAKNGDHRQITIEPQENSLKVYSSADEGSIEQFVDVEITGEAFPLTINANYTVSAIKSFRQETVTFYLEAERKPLFIFSEEDPSLTQLILPVMTRT